MMLYNPYNPKNRLITKEAIEKIIPHVTVRHVGVYQTAMVHSSYVKRKEYTTPTGEATQLAPRPSNCLELFDASYERLEHLGDSVLGACVSTYLLTRFPEENEGFLTDLKKEVVCNDTLGILCQKVGLDTFYVISRHNEDICFGRSNIKKLGDILEAFIGAMWEDTNHQFDAVYTFVVSLIETYIDIPKLLLNNRNYKEQFQKMYQSRYHLTPTYYIISNDAGIYEMGVNDVTGRCIGRGVSPTKKQAEQLAAKQAIEYLTD